MQLFTTLVAILALATPIFASNRCNRYVTTATSDGTLCSKESPGNECKNLCSTFLERIKSISSNYGGPAPGDPLGSSFITLDNASSACSGDSGLNPASTSCTCNVRMWRGRTYLFPVPPGSGSISWDIPGLEWDQTFRLMDGKKVRCGS
ncbi:hypothetical protein IAQ61_001591 [Plenodomus lingam]|uniref:Uncharacterized protein n=1 Tax=Leptosphaeria maculans (strain JN3 / isolate v23.1.3 / race Av1-4-5-6-7-8) TaxID=985895 RepID=E4ZFR0_LEPMJ|nr:predicted protein [Plenodomus lingam JN3]KAH9878320.1 hypothetical protein IAQ61_001591 [Plenodomus lingam]CBX90130.1 predicted protein [Plenodomus lingam JN3]